MIQHNFDGRAGGEAGNAVTLTLLGLAAAIMAGVVVLFFIGKSAPQPVAPIVEEEVSTPTIEEEVDPTATWNTYTYPEFDFSFKYPPGWVVATGTLFGSPSFSVYPAQGATGTAPYSPLDVGIPHVSVYPRGLSTEGIFVDAHHSDVIVPIAQASAKDYQVSSGRPWATVARFAEYPSSWEEYGFVFAGATIEELEFGCLQGEEEVTIDECNYFEGDRMLVHGFVDPTVREPQEEVLRSFVFTHNKEEDQADTIEDQIQVTSPEEGVTIVSPLVVRGEARGTWYFEGDFPVRLETHAGEVLAEVPATALDEWMTEEFVPFEVSIAFEETTATSGLLVLEKDNPSGLAEYDQQLSIPVLFTHASQATSTAE